MQAVIRPIPEKAPKSWFIFWSNARQMLNRRLARLKIS